MQIGTLYQVLHVLQQVISLFWVLVLFVGDQKSKLIAHYTLEAELTVLASASEEANRLRDLLFHIPYYEKSIPLILIHCDSTASIGRAQNRNNCEKCTIISLSPYDVSALFSLVICEG